MRFDGRHEPSPEGIKAPEEPDIASNDIYCRVPSGRWGTGRVTTQRADSSRPWAVAVYEQDRATGEPPLCSLRRALEGHTAPCPAATAQINYRVQGMTGEKEQRTPETL